MPKRNREASKYSPNKHIKQEEQSLDGNLNILNFTETTEQTLPNPIDNILNINNNNNTIEEDTAEDYLSEIPEDVLHQVFTYLPLRTQLSMRASSKYFNEFFLGEKGPRSLEYIRELKSIPFSGQYISDNERQYGITFNRFINIYNQAQNDEIKIIMTWDPIDLELKKKLEDARNSHNRNIIQLKDINELLTELHVDSINKEIARCKSERLDLEVTGFNKIKLTRFPQKVFKREDKYWENLRWLYISSNQLTTLPAEIGNLKALIVLDAKQNQLSDLPSNISELPNLKNASFMFNRLTEASLRPLEKKFGPDWVKNTLNLQRQSFSDNFRGITECKP